MRYAGFWRRLGAGLVDLAVLVPCTLLVIWIQGQSRTAALAIEVPWALLYAAYSIYFHGRWGQSIGKMAAGIRVVDVTGRPMSWEQAFLRFSVDVILGFAGAASVIVGLWRISPAEYVTLSWSERAQRIAELSPGDDVLTWATSVWVWGEIVVLLFNQRRRAIHDFIAGTVVIHVDPPSRRGRPLEEEGTMSGIV